MTFSPEPAASVLEAFSVDQPVFITQTTLATIWKVTRKNQERAALKIYHDPTIPDERAGFDLLDVWHGQGAAQLFGVRNGAALLEWLDGPTLGDLARNGQLEQADARLVAAAVRLHETPAQAKQDMPDLDRWCRALRRNELPSALPEHARHIMQRARKLADALITEQTDVRPLHGDLHHDNIICSPRGDLAFDPKGIVGDRAYELATGFLNPVGAPETVRNPARVLRRSAMWGQAFDVAPERLLDWAAMHVALSAAWQLDDGRIPDFDMLHLLWAVRDGSE
ncbi:aminoglycoside phosphotransferase family protein [Cognatiyoonia sp. IB215182]|uniref:aminoglycoside phosphotransferase family protein n=1 Tax=Cognatiyoonia sp. IB215182 TaxID=3097353 RepID=UPI002A14A571|nr:aminoglycoside phosphotransferase family protein [Cognatiyoonia sp. IB215182]MDX8354451.1 aminoglycoside phosphotransferase family protein [Cognatiyoonia sp. IB215182]